MKNIEKEDDDIKCYFSTFVDETTTTCSRDGMFDFNGWPIKLCDKFDSCERIKEMNKKGKTSTDEDQK